MSSTDMILSQNCFLQVQRGITKKTHIQELWLLCSAHRLMMLTVILVWNFMNISWTVLKLYSGHDFVTETATYDVKPVINCFRVVVCLNSSLEKFSWLVQRRGFYSWRSICCLNLIFYWNMKHIQSNEPQTHEVLQDYIFHVVASRG